MNKGGASSGLNNLIDANAEGAVRGINASSFAQMGNDSFSSGYGSQATGNNSFAEGYASRAEGYASHSEGWTTKAIGNSSHAEGYCSTAYSTASHSEGNFTIAEGAYQHVEGKYNIASTAYAHIVGNGDSSTRSNAYTLDWNGNGTFAGKATVGVQASDPMDLVTLSQLQENVPSPLAAYYTVVGDGTTTSFNITHNLNNKKIVVSVNITDSNNNTYMATNSTIGDVNRISYVVNITGLDSINVKFSSAPLTNGATISIVSTAAFEEAIDNLLLLDAEGDEYLKIN